MGPFADGGASHADALQTGSAANAAKLQRWGSPEIFANSRFGL
jgi:hypothetical protein